MALKDRITAIVTRVQRLKAMRVLAHFGETRGPILASGMAYQALFAVFAALWVGFSVAGFVVSGDVGLRDAILDALDRAIPGLIDDGSGRGAIDPDELEDALGSGIGFSISGVVAIGGLLFTALSWLSAARAAVRDLFELPPNATNFALAKLIDLAVGVGFAVLLLIAAGLSFAGSSATDLVLGWLDVADDSLLGTVASRATTLVIAVIVYGIALFVLYRLLARVTAPWRLLRGGVVIGAIGIAGLTVAGGLLLGGAQNNPLIASFAVIAGLLIYYNLSCQVVLIAAAWVAVGVDDEGLVLDEAVYAARLERARKLVAANEPEPEPRRGWWARIFGRDRHGDVGSSR